MPRIFAAIPVVPTSHLKGLIHDGKIILGEDTIKWVKTTQLHVTLKFFGETPESRIPDIVGLLSAMKDQHRKFQCVVKGLGVFGSRYQPRVIWAGIDDDLPLRNLVDDLMTGFEKIGFAKDPVSFVPHLTIARMSHIQDKKALSAWIESHQKISFQILMVDKIVLFQSTLHSCGSVHTAIGDFSLSS